MDRFHLEPMHPAGGCTRRHAIKVFAAAATGAILEASTTRRLHAALPWGEQRDAELLEADGAPLHAGPARSYEKQIRQADPTVVLEGGGSRIWTTWSSFRDGAERILLRSFVPASRQWGEVSAVSEHDVENDGPASDAEAVCTEDGRLIIIWVQRVGGGWMLCMRAFCSQTGELGPVRVLAGSPDGRQVIRRPALATNGRAALATWEVQGRPGDAFEIHGRLISADGSPLGRTIAIAADAGGDCCRPAVAGHPRAEAFAVAYDRQEGPGTQNVHLVFVNSQSGAIADRRQASAHPASDLTPALAWSPDASLVWIAWHSNRAGRDGWDIPRWYRLAAFRVSDKSWHQPVASPLGRDLEKRSTDQGFELVRLAVGPTGVVCVLGRPSHNFCVQYYTGREPAPLYRLARDGWGGRGRFLRAAFDGSGGLWVARRDLGANVLQRIGGFGADLAPPQLEPVEEPSRASGRLRGIAQVHVWPTPSARPGSQVPKAAYDGLNLYFGDLHSHSWQSDGMGEPEENYLRARDVFRDDFYTLTDHDRFVGKRVMDGEWQQQKDIAEHYHKPGRFVTLFAQEWTTPRVTHPLGYGHFNIYSADPGIPLFDHTDPGSRHLADLYPQLREHEAFAVPHHIGWTGVPWEKLDAELVPAVEICSVHGVFEYEGNRPIRHRGGLKGCFVQDGLARGLRFGLVGGSDQHGLIWHHGICWKRDAYRAGLTGVWAPALTREQLMDALRARRTFATTGVKLCMRFAVDEAVMGSEARVEAPPAFRVEVAVPPSEGRLHWLEIVRDGQVIHRYGGEGQHSRYTFVDTVSGGRSVSTYYLRVVLSDNNMAWSSPIWVTQA
jgi:hypothetical protein